MFQLLCRNIINQIFRFIANLLKPEAFYQFYFSISVMNFSLELLQFKMKFKFDEENLIKVSSSVIMIYYVDDDERETGKLFIRLIVIRLGNALTFGSLDSSKHK